jgi:hypothetical protein
MCCAVLLVLQFAPPVFLPVPRADGSYSHLRGQHGVVVLLSDDGAVVALNSKGQKLWHVSNKLGGVLYGNARDHVLQLQCCIPAIVLI